MCTKVSLQGKTFRQVSQDLNLAVTRRNVLDKLRKAPMTGALCTKNLNIVTINEYSAHQFKQTITRGICTATAEICKVFAPRRQILSPQHIPLLLLNTARREPVVDNLTCHQIMGSTPLARLTLNEEEKRLR
jgi:hypothetical protein